MAAPRAHAGRGAGASVARESRTGGGRRLSNRVGCVRAARVPADIGCARRQTPAAEPAGGRRRRALSQQGELLRGRRRHHQPAAPHQWVQGSRAATPAGCRPVPVAARHTSPCRRYLEPRRASAGGGARRDPHQQFEQPGNPRGPRGGIDQGSRALPHARGGAAGAARRGRQGATARFARARDCGGARRGPGALSCRSTRAGHARQRLPSLGQPNRAGRRSAAPGVSCPLWMPRRRCAGGKAGARLQRADPGKPLGTDARGRAG